MCCLTSSPYLHTLPVARHSSHGVGRTKSAIANTTWTVPWYKFRVVSRRGKNRTKAWTAYRASGRLICRVSMIAPLWKARALSILILAPMWSMATDWITQVHQCPETAMQPRPYRRTQTRLPAIHTQATLLQVMLQKQGARLLLRPVHLTIPVWTLSPRRRLRDRRLPPIIWRWHLIQHSQHLIQVRQLQAQRQQSSLTARRPLP
jgi:hypothetical protein